MKLRLMRLLLAIFVILLNLTGCSHKDGPSEGFTLTFIHVGKGDAFLMTVPGDGYYLVDTGKKKDFEEIREVLEEKGITRLRGIFLSHGHKDHAGGLERILEEYPTKRVYLSGLKDPSFKKVDAWEVAEEAGVPVEELFLGDELVLGPEEVTKKETPQGIGQAAEKEQGLSDGQTMPVCIQVLGPELVDEENENNNSLILRVVYGDTAFLLMGDAELASEERLLASGARNEEDVLKLGHHGKMDATSEELLEQVSPAYGIVTANREKEEDSADPAMEDRLREARVQVYYSEGKIRGVDFLSDGQEVRVKEY